jgi:hypothetical protein
VLAALRWKLASSRLKQVLGGGNIANLTTEASLPSERFVFEFIMAVLFHRLFFVNTFLFADRRYLFIPEMI